MANRPGTDIAIRLRNSVKETIEVMAIMVKELNEDGYSNRKATEIDLIVTFIDQYDEHAIAKMFLDKQNSWGKIIDNDIEFFTGPDLQSIFKELPIDATALNEPMVLYAAYKKGKVPARKKAFPITDDNIATLWKRFINLLKGACQYEKSAGLNLGLDKYRARLGVKI